jgi:S1-C subfamily serine protease
VRQIVPYLISDGKFVYPFLGVQSLQELSLALQEQLNLPQATGAYVSVVVAGGPADQAGIRGDSSSDAAQGDGDLIVAIDGQEVKVFADLLSHLVNHTRPGQTVTLTIIREGQRMDVPVVLGERP